MMDLGTIELATLEDLPAILALANWAAENTPANFATSAEPLSEWTASWNATHETHPWLVARNGNGGRVVGFAKGSPHRARGAYHWTAEVAVYIDPGQHRKGIGRALYAALIPTLRAQGYVTLLAGISTPNPGSEGLHASVGFVRCGTYHRAGWKFSRWHDVGYWELHLQREHLPPEPIRSVYDVWPKVRRLRSGELEIRSTELRSRDAASLIAALDRELSTMYPEPGANHFELSASEVAEQRGAFVVAYADEEAVGCGAIRARGDRDAEVKRMFVSPRWRGLGISKAVLASLEKEARRLGAARLVLETGTRQLEAIALYERCGYRPIPLFGEYVHSPLTSVCLAKAL